MKAINIRIDNKVHSENTITVTEGAVFKDLQLLSKHFANQPNGESILISPKVLIINSDRCQSTNNIGHLLKESFESRQPLVIILNQVDPNNFGSEILAAMQKGLQATILKFTSAGKKLDEDLYLLSKAFNTKIIDDGNFDNVAKNIPNLSELVTLDKVTASSEETNFEGKFRPEAIIELEKELENETDLEKRAKLSAKLSILRGKNVTIGLSAETKPEFKEVFDRLDDALGQVKSALVGGVVPLSSHSLTSLPLGLKSYGAFRLIGDTVFANAKLLNNNKDFGKVLNARTNKFEDWKDGLFESCKMQKDLINTALSLVKVLSNIGCILNTNIQDKLVYSEPEFNAIDKVLEASKWMFDIVHITLGSSGKVVAYRDGDGRISMTKDGVSIIKSLYHEDTHMNMVVQEIKHASLSMLESNSDATTSVIVLTYGMLLEIFNNELTLEDLESECNQIIQWLDELSKPIESLDDIYHVAMVASNSDKVLANLIKDSYRLCNEEK